MPLYEMQPNLLAQQAGRERAQMQAQMVGERLAQLGPEGEQWASRLAQDPIAGMSMMQQYGGPEQVEFGLRHAQAAGRGATARELENLVLQHGGGAAGFAKYGTGMKGIADANRANMRGLDRQGVLQLRGEITKRSDDFRVQRDFFGKAFAAAKRAATKEYASDEARRKAMGAADFVLVQALGKMIDPKSAVRNEEGEFIQDAGEDNLGAMLHEASRWFGENGVMSSNARANLMNQIEALYAQAESSHRQTMSIYGKEMGNLPVEEEYLRGLLIPDVEDPDTLEPIDFQSLLQTYEEAAGRLVSTNPSPGARPKPRVFRNKTTGKIVKGFVDADGVKRDMEGNPI